MSRRDENTAFTCEHCGLHVLPLENGSYRNHCPRCLYSKHVDVTPGDRSNSCRGLMRPSGLCYHPSKGMQLVHTCLACGHRQANRIARDTAQPDDLACFPALLAGEDGRVLASKRRRVVRCRPPPTRLLGDLASRARVYWGQQAPLRMTEL